MRWCVCVCVCTGMTDRHRQTGRQTDLHKCNRLFFFWFRVFFFPPSSCVLNKYASTHAHTHTHTHTLSHTHTHNHSLSLSLFLSLFLSLSLSQKYRVGTHGIGKTVRALYLTNSPRSFAKNTASLDGGWSRSGRGDRRLTKCVLKNLRRQNRNQGRIFSSSRLS